MSFVNHYALPSTAEDIPEDYYSPEPFDVNFCFPIEKHFDQLESDRVKLVVFEPRLHARPYIEALAKSPDVLQWISSMPMTMDQFLPAFERHFRRDPLNCTFAVIDKFRPNPAHPELDGGLAGIASLMTDTPASLSLEIGIITFPAFQRSYVTTHAISLLLKLSLEVAPKGLGIRRVYWRTHSKNHRSVKAAERLGFRMEGMMRWHRVLAEGEEGNGIPLREGDPEPNSLGRDSLQLSLCWDDWEMGGREYIAKLMTQ